MRRRPVVSTCAYTTPLNLNLILDVVLRENRVNRRRAREQCKRKKSLHPRRRIEDFNSRYNGGDCERHRRLRHLYCDVSCNAKRAVRMRDVANRMGVNSLNYPSRQNQQHAKQGEENPPRALHIRFWPKAQHYKSNIAQDLPRKNTSTHHTDHYKRNEPLQHIEN